MFLLIFRGLLLSLYHLKQNQVSFSRILQEYWDAIISFVFAFIFYKELNNLFDNYNLYNEFLLAYANASTSTFNSESNFERFMVEFKYIL